MKTLTLIGAYGRNASLKDWEAGKDFKILDGPYCSIRDLDLMRKQGFTEVKIRKQDGHLLKWINLTENREVWSGQ